MNSCTLNVEKLRKLREDEEWSQGELGNRTENYLFKAIDGSTISKMERQKNAHRLDYVNAIAKVFAEESEKCEMSFEEILSYLEVKIIKDDKLLKKESEREFI
ncbi:unnamed protein product, partial [marine sediment metagenome]